MIGQWIDGMQEHVAAAARYMDVHYPGWFQLIDLDALDLRTTCDCVLGQTVVGRYADIHTWSDAMARIFMTSMDGEINGRTTAPGLGFCMDVFAASAAQPVWVQEVKRRRMEWQVAPAERKSLVTA